MEDAATINPPVPAELRTDQPARNDQPRVKANRLTHLIFQRPDLERAVRFLKDFGLRVASQDADTVYLRGTGTAPYCYRIHRAAQARFIGFGLEVPARADLERLAELPGASAITTVRAPGGGEMVVLHDPAGVRVEAIFGQSQAAPMPFRAPLALNSPAASVRVNDTQRLPPAPSEIIKLGHVVLEAVNFQETAAFYTNIFGLIPSDVQVLPDGSPLVAFMRLNLGDEPTDHHTLALAQGVVNTYSHSAYEVADADAVGMGQRILRERGWRHAWGIGRHILGSQIFDYWEDPWGDKHEHYCDGDLFTAAHPTGVYAASRQAMSQWGQAMPVSFAKPKLSLLFVVKVIANVSRSSDLSFAKVRTMLKLFG